MRLRRDATPIAHETRISSRLEAAAEAVGDSSTMDSGMEPCAEGSLVKVYVGSMFLWGHANPATHPEFDVHVSFIGSISEEGVATSHKAQDAVMCIGASSSMISV